MKNLQMRIARFFSSGFSEAEAQDTSLINDAEVRAQSDVAWNEMLLASMSDESARWLVDHWGPRGR